MAETHFKIVFEGKLRTGVDIETAKLNMAGLFKRELSAVEKLFSGQPVALKRGLSQEQALHYLSVLNDAGIEARIEADPAISLSLEEIDEPKSYRAPEESQHGASPYAPPRAQVGAAWPAFGELNVFTVQGRIGRLRYLAWTLVLMVAILAVTGVCAAVLTRSLVGGGLLIAIAAIGFFIVSVQIGVQRLHDVGWSGWLLLINLVPFVGSLFPILMMVIPGNAGANQYGAPQPPNTKAVKALASLWLAIIAILMVGAFVGGIATFESEVQTTTSEYENNLPYDDDNDNDTSQPADSQRL
jgi:uncharacterized membrane protein YhaH (DUF805 family)